MSTSSNTGRPLASISELFTRAWERFLHTWLSLLIVMLCSVCAGIVFGILCGLLIAVGVGIAAIDHQLVAPLVILGAPLALAALFGFWLIGTTAEASMLMVVKEKTQHKGALGIIRKAMKVALPFWWVRLLYSLVVSVGVLFFIPALYFGINNNIPAAIALSVGGLIVFIIYSTYTGVRYGFQNWAFIEDGKHSIEALRTSDSLVRGRFLGVFGRLFVIGLLAFAISLVFSVLQGISSIGDDSSNSGISLFFAAIQNIISIPVSFFGMAFLYEMYSDLKKTR